MHDDSGTVRITGSRFELTAPTPDGGLVEVGLDIGSDTAHVLRHLVATHIDLPTGQRHRCARRSLIQRALRAVGADPDHLEVLPGQPPRFVLVVVGPDGCVRRVDLDLVDTAELIVVAKLPVRAVGWPPRDWDAGLASLLEGGNAQRG